jgi:3-deoxy-7-phosphoheptulonate synthase
MPKLDDPLHDAEIGSRDSTIDTTRIDDVRIGAVRPLMTPALLQERVPVQDDTLALVEASRAAIANILHGRDDRLIVVVGPCSIHDHDQAIEYAHQLKKAADDLEDDLLIVMRTYFEKPRTTVGWKGYINDPHLDGSFAINEGLERARRLLLELTLLGLPTGTEFLDLLSPQFIADLIAWGAIGARTTESQSHRQLASGLSCPVGFKNGTDGRRRHPCREGAARFHGHDQDGNGGDLRDPRQRRLSRDPAWRKNAELFGRGRGCEL